MTNLDLPRRSADGSCGVGKEERPPFGIYQAEEQAGLSVVIVIVFAEIPVVCSPLKVMSTTDFLVQNFFLQQDQTSDRICL